MSGLCHSSFRESESSSLDREHIAVAAASITPGRAISGQCHSSFRKSKSSFDRECCRRKCAASVTPDRAISGARAEQQAACATREACAEQQAACATHEACTRRRASHPITPDRQAKGHPKHARDLLLRAGGNISGTAKCRPRRPRRYRPLAQKRRTSGISRAAQWLSPTRCCLYAKT